MSLLPRYTHIINPKLKHTYLSFDDKGNLIIKSPKISQAELEKILLKKAAWINRAKKKIREKKGRQPDFAKEGQLYFKGEPYPLKLIKHEKRQTSLDFDQKEFILFYHHYDENLFNKHINRFYKESAMQNVPSLVEKWSKQMQLFPKRITFRKTKRQWGSCSSSNHLSFNTMMMKLPKNVIEYIIVHELAHIKHKHHQKSFWNCVEAAMPDYKEQRALLKHYTTY